MATPTVVIRRLTPDLARTLEAAATRALTGDGSCSLANMSTSCFASEQCARGRTPHMLLQDMLHSRHPFVALDATSGAFVGCATADLVHSVHRQSFHAYPFEPDALMLSNLCVSASHRKCGAGRALVESVLAVGPPSGTYLLIDQTGTLPSSSIDEPVHTTMADRVARLRTTYARLHFYPVAECRRTPPALCALLLKHLAPRPVPMPGLRWWWERRGPSAEGRSIATRRG